jgi:hypothetical protein
MEVEEQLMKTFPTLRPGGARTIANQLDAPNLVSTVKLREIGRIKTSQITRAKLGKKGIDGERAGWLALPDISEEIFSQPKVPLWSRRKALSCLYKHHESELSDLRRAGIHPFLPKWVGGAGCIPNGTRRLTDLTIKERKRVAVLSATKTEDGHATDLVTQMIRRYQYGWNALSQTKASLKAHNISRKLTEKLKESGDPSHGGLDSFQLYTDLKVKLTALQTRDPNEDRTPAKAVISRWRLGRKFAKIDKAARKLRPYINPMGLQKIAALTQQPPETAKRYVLNSSREKIIQDIERAFTFRPDGERLVPEWVTRLLNESGEWDELISDRYPKIFEPNN